MRISKLQLESEDEHDGTCWIASAPLEIGQTGRVRIGTFENESESMTQYAVFTRVEGQIRKVAGDYIPDLDKFRRMRELATQALNRHGPRWRPKRR
jgi:hypothetical protein